MTNLQATRILKALLGLRFEFDLTNDEIDALDIAIRLLEETL